MSYTIVRTNRFKKSLKRCLKRGLNEQLIKDAIILLVVGHERYAVSQI